MSWGEKNYKKLKPREANDMILKRVQDRAQFFSLLIKLFQLSREKRFRMVVENPWSIQTYFRSGFVMNPTFIDNNRMLRGDYYVKPTAYWFLNCEPTHGFTEQCDKEKKSIVQQKKGKQAGVCSEDRSAISPDYARNFICDFIIGKEQQGTQLTIF